MTKYVIAWGIGTWGIFLLAVLAGWFMDFCEAHEKQWWGGAPLWIAGGMGGLIPMLALIVYILYKVVHG